MGMELEGWGFIGNEWNIFIVLGMAFFWVFFFFFFFLRPWLAIRCAYVKKKRISLCIKIDAIPFDHDV